MFRALWRYIDIIDVDDYLLEMIGIDDLFYRNISILLHQQMFHKKDVDTQYRRNNTRGLIGRICDAMKDMCRKPFTMTELERLSCVSSINL